jgi:HNH endonuclease
MQEKILKPILNKGYLRVTLSRDGLRHYVFPHQLVMVAFVGPPPSGMEVRHRYGNRADSRLVNLCYGTRAQNIDDARKHGTFPHKGNWQAGAGHPKAKITVAIAREIFQSMEPVRILMDRHGLSKGAIQAIQDRRNWRVATADLPDVVRIGQRRVSP